MATELPQPSPTPAEVSATDDELSPSLTPVGAVVPADVPVAPTGAKGGRDDGGNARQQHTNDVRCDRCGRWFPPGLIATDPHNLANLDAKCAQALADLAAQPIIEADAPAVRLTELYVVAAVDATTGDEGIMAMMVGGGQLEIPLVTDSLDKLSAIVAWARVRADNESLKYRVYRCRNLEDVTDKALSVGAKPTQP